MSISSLIGLNSVRAPSARRSRCSRRLGTSAGEIHRTIKEAGGNSLESLRAFDEYRGDQAGEGRKSIAFTLTFRSPERTLTDAEVEKVMSEIRKRLEKKHGARIRT